MLKYAINILIMYMKEYKFLNNKKRIAVALLFNLSVFLNQG
ncbi:hypothetical protein CJD_A0571 [Clostridium perfringens D str. JGS1721]|uniref:Uncharacterized protein n=1 Tax=Clostridium perfringens D str. JGS1721 TaxID=488537 RepID=B1V639_CLOPF|nr:hypothetical protein CJD_A0571 [Clostridium perfringens D str. JGS1721]